MATHTCRICGSADLHKAIDLGVMPNANNLVPKGLLNKVKSYPLCFYWCGNCTLFQQVELAPREDLFNKNYPYVTGVNAPSVEDFKNFALEIKKQLPRRRFAVIIGSNDGTEIRLLEEFGGFKKVIGVDPSDNLAKMANERGLFTINEFFGYELSKDMVKKYGEADLVVAKGVFGHIPDPKDLLLGMKNLIADDGYIEIEVHYVKSLIENMMIDTLYAEHYYEWTVKAMKVLANSIGLKVADVEYLPMRGGSIRVLLKKHGSEKVAEKFIADETRAGLSSPKTIGDLQRRADEKGEKLRSMVLALKAKGKSVSVWTAAAKVPTLFNFAGITNKEIDYAYDTTETKIGKFIPKANIEIKRENRVYKDMPDYLILGSWNYLDVALKKFAEYMDMGGKLINPLTMEVIESKRRITKKSDKPTGSMLDKKMRKDGKGLYASLMRGDKHRINGIKVVSSQKIGHLYIQEIHYKVEDVDGYWTKVLSHKEKAAGVTVVPVIREGGNEYLVLLFKPQPAMGAWSIALPSGAVKKGETAKECAARELEEETGLKAGKMQRLMLQANLPERTHNIDQVFVAEDVIPGKKGGEYEEKAIKTIVLSIPEIADLLDKNKIQSAMVTAVLSTYLQKRNPLVKAAFNAIRQGK